MCSLLSLALTAAQLPPRFKFRHACDCQVYQRLAEKEFAKKQPVAAVRKISQRGHKRRGQGRVRHQLGKFDKCQTW